MRGGIIRRPKARFDPAIKGGAHPGDRDIGVVGELRHLGDLAPSVAGEDELAYKRHERSVMKLLSHRHQTLDGDERREIYQEAWASVLKRRADGATIDNLGAYLHSAADKLAAKRVYGAPGRDRDTGSGSGIDTVALRRDSGLSGARSRTEIEVLNWSRRRDRVGCGFTRDAEDRLGANSDWHAGAGWRRCPRDRPAGGLPLVRVPRASSGSVPMRSPVPTNAPGLIDDLEAARGRIGRLGPPESRATTPAPTSTTPTEVAIRRLCAVRAAP